jgi:GST-like protein
MYTLYGKPGWGSVIVEAQLEIAGLPYRMEEVDPLESAADRERLAKFNSLAQLPTLILPDGKVMTESAAITLHLGDRAPGAGLVPSAGDETRDAFLRWLVFIVANIYPTFTVGDDPSRYVSDPAAQKELRVSTENYKSRCWQMIESSIAPKPWFLGTRFSALDIYAGAMTRWRPQRAWFKENCPKIHGVALAADNAPHLSKAWRRNFP